MDEPWQLAGFGLYVHWPFCSAKCPYCDFNSHVAREIDQSRWLRAYISEIDRLADETSERVLSTVYFGGGTPSLMDPELVAALLDHARKCWQFVNDPEITLEANPTSVEANRFSRYAQAGVNRISMGIQALNDADLQRLGRQHTVREALMAVDIARANFQRVSFDLIYGRQDQKVKDWEVELRRAVDLAGDHLSLYQLTIEEGTAFFDRRARGGLCGLPDDVLGAELYEVTQSLTSTAGLPAYEISNHAAAGNEARHNLIYWRSGDYAGIGPGAHGRLTIDGVRHATSTELSPLIWMGSVEATGSGERQREAIPEGDQLDEMLMMGLRLTEGIDIDRLRKFAKFQDYSQNLSRLEEDGVLDTVGGHLCVAAECRAVLNEVIRQIVT